MIGQLDLLTQRFPAGVMVPRAVWREVVEAGKGRPDSEEVSSRSWIEVREVEDTSLVSLLVAELDEGEAEAIALAREKQSPLILLDEKDARQVARRLGFQTLGTVGILIWARRAGMFASLREQLHVLQTDGRFRLSTAVHQEALRIVGETEQ